MRRSILGAAILSVALALPASALAYTSPTWNLNGTYTIALTCTAGCDGVYPHSMTIQTTSDTTGAVTGIGYYIDDPSITWTITGAVTGWDVTLNVDYDGSAYAVAMIGKIDQYGGMAGKATGPGQAFDWKTTSGSVGLISPQPCDYGTYPNATKVWGGFAPGTGGVITTPALNPALDYFVEASGTYFAGGVGLFDIEADAEYSQDSFQRAAGSPWTDAVNGYESYGEVLLDLLIDGANVEWGAYNSSHRYTHAVTPTGDPLDISANLYDIAPGNNTGGICVALYSREPATIRLMKNVVPAFGDDSLWNFVITNGNDKTYQTYADQSAPFDSGVLTIHNPTAIEIDEWAGTGTDIADFTASVACTDNGSPLTPTASSYYDVGSQTRFYVYFIPAQRGHAYVCTFTNTNPYEFTGFFAPVDNPTAVNAAKAGSAIPVKFSLDGYQGLDIFAAGYPKVAFTACTATPAEQIDETVPAGGSSLTYDPIADQYIYVWKTQKSWAGTCGQLQVKLADGTVHTANFKFK